MKDNKSVMYVNGREVEFNGERNVLEVVRKAGIDLPTFCYHSELSVYGACRLCVVEIEGRGVTASCSIVPEPGMRIRTHSAELREMRKISVELLLANEGHECTTCSKNRSCQLQDIAKRLGVEKVRFKTIQKNLPLDTSNASIVRDPNKCVLCGDCVRFCEEVQGIGAIGFARRGADVTVTPAFGKNLGDVECVYCGQCASVCPTGAITPRSEVDEVWNSLQTTGKTVVAQIAPAVRVALGEMFGMEPGKSVTGQIVAALKRLGFHKVYDTSFAADLTVMEEGTEFLGRIRDNGAIPQFTSCCPGWVKFAEQYYPELLDNLSTCRSPQQMLGSLAKEMLPTELGVKREDIVVVSIMPCTAKKFEAKRPEFSKNGSPEVDHVLTTQELAAMIEQGGIVFKDLGPESMDMPLGFKTGAGILFGNSGGVSEAVLRFAVEKLSGQRLEQVDFHEVRGEDGIRETTVEVGGKILKLCIVHGLRNARKIAEQVRAGESEYDFIEVMACPGGCIGGAGQPVSRMPALQRQARARGLYEADKNLDLHKAQDNPSVQECYKRALQEPGSHRAHELLHTQYQNRRRIITDGVPLMTCAEPKVKVQVCVGTSCFLRGSQQVLHALTAHIEKEGLENAVDVRATFCSEKCERGPVITINGEVMEHCTAEAAIEAVNANMAVQAK